MAAAGSGLQPSGAGGPAPGDGAAGTAAVVELVVVRSAGDPAGEPPPPVGGVPAGRGATVVGVVPAGDVVDVVVRVVPGTVEVGVVAGLVVDVVDVAGGRVVVGVPGASVVEVVGGRVVVGVPAGAVTFAVARPAGGLEAKARSAGMTSQIPAAHATMTTVHGDRRFAGVPSCMRPSTP